MRKARFEIANDHEVGSTDFPFVFSGDDEDKRGVLLPHGAVAENLQVTVNGMLKMIGSDFQMGNGVIWFEPHMYVDESATISVKGEIHEDFQDRLRRYWK